MKIESRIGKSTQKATDLYHYISDFRNFEKFLPKDQVSEWEASQDQCSFRISNIGKMSIRIVDMEAGKMIKMQSVPEGSSQNFTLWTQLKSMAENDTRIRLTIEPKVNQLLLGMIKPQLKKFVDSLVDRMETLDPKTGQFL